jgi:hypothetical protein
MTTFRTDLDGWVGAGLSGSVPAACVSAGLARLPRHAALLAGDVIAAAVAWGYRAERDEALLAPERVAARLEGGLA